MTMPKTISSRRAARRRKVKQPIHEFTLIFSGIDEITAELSDAIFEAGCDDALFGMQNGEVFLDFHREAPSFRVALMSAIANVERADIGLELIRVEPIDD
jgi:hypothetical protein